MKKMKGMNSIDTSVLWGDYFRMGEFNVIGKGVKIGSRVTLHDHIVIEDNVLIGSDCEILPFVYLRTGAVIGNGVKLDPYTGVDVDVEYKGTEGVIIHAEDEFITDPNPVTLEDLKAPDEDDLIPGTVEEDAMAATSEEDVGEF